MFDKVRRLFSSARREAELQAHLEALRSRIPVPVFWLDGKTQSGKTTLIKYLTGAGDAEIGQGFRPCTRFSREYEFPTHEAPVLTFLDTRGLDEPGYDPAEDIARFRDRAHVVLVTVKAMDHAQENVLNQLRAVRRDQPNRPVVLVLTCLHEAYPQQQHPPYSVVDGGRWMVDGNDSSSSPPTTHHPPPTDLLRSIAEQRQRFEGLVDRVVPLDITPPEEGFQDPNYGGEALKAVILEVLPAAYRQTFLTVEEANRSLRDLYARHATPFITFYSLLATTAGAIPVPWVDLLILPGIQTRMVHHLAKLYGQPLKAQHFGELAGALGVGLLVRQGIREVMKFIPYVGSVAGGALAGASTFALGKAACFYYSGVQQGHAPTPDEIRRYYAEQFDIVQKSWSAIRGAPTPAPSDGIQTAPARSASDGIQAQGPGGGEPLAGASGL
jgi:uncharacterized protein (DUF697 family)